MKKITLLFIVLVSLALTGDQEGRLEFFIGDGEYVELLEFKFESPTGYSKISAVENPDLGRFYGKFDHQKLSAKFIKSNSRGTKKASLAISNTKSNTRVNDALNSYSRVENEWELYLSKRKKHRISLKYGSGNANINLSELAVEKLLIDNSSASIVMDYESKLPNVIEMDSMIIRLNKGYMRINRAYYAKAKYLEVKVKYGTVSIDLSDEFYTHLVAKGKIGNGTLRIDLPPAKTPMKITVHGGKFGVEDLTSDFHELSDDVYVNDAYYINAPKSFEAEFNIAFGKLIFNRK